MEELIEENNYLRDVVSNGTMLVEALETKLKNLHKENQTIKKEMQVLIYKTQKAYVEVDRKNSIIGSIIIFNFFVFICWIAYLVFNFLNFI